MPQFCKVEAKEPGLVWNPILVALTVQPPESDHSMTWSYQQLGYAYMISCTYFMISRLTSYVGGSINTLVSCPSKRFCYNFIDK